jgi:hypothetical protein
VGHFGFRLFVVHLREGQKRSNLDFSTAGGRHFADLLEADIQARLNETFNLEDTPRQQADGTLTSPTGAIVRYTNLQRNENSIFLSFYHGPYGDGGTLIDPDGLDYDQDIENRAVSKIYRSLFAFPDEGGAGILAVETHGRACPYRRLEFSLRTIYSSELRLYLASGVADKAAVAHFIRNGIVRELEVTTHGVARDGIPAADRVTLTVKIPGATRLQDTMREHALRWVSERWEKLTNQQARRELANDLAATATGVTIPLDFEDSVLRVDGPNDRKRSLKPSSEIGEWIYDTGEHRLEDKKWYDSTYSAIKDIFPMIAATEGVIPPK